jgi:hypothetical protein
MAPPSVWRRATGVTAAVAATAFLIALVASRPGSPFTPPLLPDAGAPGWLVRPGTALGLDGLSRDALAVVGAAALFGAALAFLWSLRAAWRGELTVRRIVILGLLLHLLAVAIPVFLSRDVYSYTIYGRMVSRLGANPYATIPAAFFDDPSYRLVSVDWIDSTSVYGPAFMAVSAAVTRAVSSPAVTVLAFKILAAVASMGTMLLVIAAARRTFPERTAFAAALIGWNPVIVFHAVAGGHNDTLLGLLVAAGVLWLVASRPARATAALALGTLVKVSGAVPLLVAAAGSIARRPAGTRLRGLALHGGVAVAVALPFVIPFLQSEDPTLGTLEVATRQGWLAPSRFVLVTLRGAARALGGDVAADVVGLVIRVAFPLVFVLVLFGILRHLWRAGGSVSPLVVGAATAWAALLSLLLSPVMLPWYVVWVLPLAWLLPRSARGGAVLVSIALVMTELVAEPSRSPAVWEAMVFGLHWVATPVMLFVLVRLILELRRRLALGPGPGLADPLVSEEVAPAAPSGGRDAVAAPARPPRSDVTGDPRDDGEDDRHGAVRREPEALGEQRRGDRQRHPD